jgi:hypothetical protein
LRGAGGLGDALQYRTFEEKMLAELLARHVSA